MYSILMPGLKINDVQPVMGLLSFVYIGKSEKISPQQMGKIWMRIEQTVYKPIIINN